MPRRRDSMGDARVDVASNRCRRRRSVRSRGGRAEEGADAVGGRGDLLDDCVHFLDGLASLGHGVLLGGEEGAQIGVPPDGIAGSKGGDGAIPAT